MSKKFCFCLSLLLTLLFAAHRKAHATEWAISIGAHNFLVKDENSNTLGGNIGFYGKDITKSGIRIHGNAEVLFDHDKDRLDPDHLPIWFKSNLGVYGNIYDFSPHLGMDWLIDVNTKQNTVSGIEQEIKLFSGTGLSYDTSVFHIGINGCLGFFFLELDDDVPVQRGYERRDLNQGTSDAYSFMADASVKIGKLFRISAQGQTWGRYGVGSNWLENQITIKLGYDSERWIKNCDIFLKIEHTQYNLGQYKLPKREAVLPWDNDTLIQVYILIPWKF